MFKLTLIVLALTSLSNAIRISKESSSTLTTTKTAEKQRYNAMLEMKSQMVQNSTEPVEGYCAEGCPDVWIGDNWCDEACLNDACE
jgi:hypothetical protein